jgi:hypothetical protein
MDFPFTKKETMGHIFRLTCLMFFVFTLSYGCQKRELKEKSRNHTKATGALRVEQEKSGRSIKPHEYVPGQILVKFRPETNDQTIEAIQEALRLKTIKVVSSPSLYLMKILDGSSVERTMERLKDFQDVAYSEPNYIVTVQ